MCQNNTFSYNYKHIYAHFPVRLESGVLSVLRGNLLRRLDVYKDKAKGAHSEMTG